MLTALSDERDEIKGFELEIDDYITKPFSFNILKKRVEAALRRGNATALGILRCNEVTQNKVGFTGKMSESLA